MKKFLLFALLLGIAHLGFAAERAQKYSALNALKAAAGTMPQSMRSQLVSITGENGRLHPVTWRLVFYDPSAIVDKRVVIVSRNEVLTNDDPFAIFDSINQTSCINLHDVKLDSDKVINTVHRLCYENKLPLYMLDIELAKKQKGNVTPLWICTLKNARGNEFGKIGVSAKTGKILETEDVVITPESRLRAEKSFGQSAYDALLGVGGDLEQFFTGKRTVDE